MSAAGKQVIIAANPKSGRTNSAQHVSELKQAIEDRGFDCHVEHSLEAVREKSNAAHARGKLRAVVSAGGDGTADALANLLQAHIPVLLFPLGTENLLAKHLKVTGDIQQACQTLVDGHQVSMDVGSANGKIFLVMLSCGFDAEVVRQMHAIRKGHISRWSYARPIVRSLMNYRFPQMRLRVDESERETSAAWIFVFNVPRYAASLDFCPQADPLDGHLDVCTFQRGGLAFGVGYFSQLFLRRHHRLKGYLHQRCEQLVIEPPGANSDESQPEIPFQIDGDPGGVLPLKIEVLPRRFCLLQPSPST